jgi:hypothetical protein
MISKHTCLTQETSRSTIIEILKTYAQSEKSPSQEAILQLLDALCVTSWITREGSDADQRPVFVNIQSYMEQALVYWLSSKDLSHVTCIIHAPAPTTPLCTEGELSEGLVDPSMFEDKSRLSTVKKRPAILRSYLQEGGFLFTVYPQEGITLRSAKQLAILQDLIKQYPHHLKSCALNCHTLPQDLIGASYLFTFSNGETYVFLLNSYQANCATDATWSLGFGCIEDPVIYKRLHYVITFLKTHGFPVTLTQKM